MIWIMILMLLFPHNYGTVDAKVYEGFDENDRYIIHLDEGGRSPSRAVLFTTTTTLSNWMTATFMK